MKIGILTLPLHFNYGGILQAYALQETLTRLGHSVYLLEKNRMLESPGIYVRLKRLIKKAIFRDNIKIDFEAVYNREMPVVCQHTWAFVDKYIKTYNYGYKLTDVKENNFDAIVVGSDQIWRRLYFVSLVERNSLNAFLQFCTSWPIKRISYAASFGTDHWEYSIKETRQARDLLRKFDLVTVRESDGVSLCSNYLGVDASVVLDPTLLMEREDYIKIFRNSNVSKKEGDLLCYILDNNDKKVKIVETLSNRLEVQPYYANSKAEDASVALCDRIQPSVEQWLYDFYNAKYVITDSFHACVFSIIFNKPFWVIGNKERGLSRFQSLLSLFSLENQLISEDDIQEIKLNEEINWDGINMKLNAETNRCKQLLYDSLL